MGPVMKQWKAPSSNSSSTLFPFFQHKGTEILVWSTYPDVCFNVKVEKISEAAKSSEQAEKLWKISHVDSTKIKHDFHANDEVIS